MMIKATTTNPTTRFCTMAATPGELMNKATGANRGDQRRAALPLEADHGAGAEMISERSRSQREHNCRPDGSANLLPRCANSMRDQKPRLRKVVRPPLPRCWRFRGERPKGTMMICCSCACRRARRTPCPAPGDGRQLPEAKRRLSVVERHDPVDNLQFMRLHSCDDFAAKPQRSTSALCQRSG